MGDPGQASGATLEPIYIDDDLPRVSIPLAVRDELCNQARETYPEECCGLVIGEGESRFARVAPCRNVATQRHAQDPANNPHDGKRSFQMYEPDYARAWKEAEDVGGFVAAVYHSHIDAGSYLSKLDLEHALHELFPFPEADHIVIAVHEQQVKEIGLFRRSRPDGPFRGFRVEPGGV